MALSGCDAELNAHIYCAASLKLQIKQTATYILHAAPFLTLKLCKESGLIPEWSDIGRQLA